MSDLQNIPVLYEGMQQIGFDLCNLLKVDGFKHLIICIDCFSKWSEAEAVINMSASTVTDF